MTSKSTNLDPSRLVLAILMLAAGFLSLSTATWASIPGQNGPMLISASVSSGGIPFSGLFDIHLGGKSTRASPIGETINSAAVSPNGALLAFSRSPGDQVWLGDRREIEKQGSLAGAIQISGIGASASDPEFSPDGRSIFYSSFLYSSGEGIEIWQVCRYWISSGKTQKLVSQFPVLETSPVPAVSPNGRLLAYSYQSPAGARIRLVRLGDRSSWTLPSNGEARLGNFSPDGSRLAYIRGPLGGSNLTVSRLDGMDSRTLGQADGIPSFSPDGTLLLAAIPSARKSWSFDFQMTTVRCFRHQARLGNFGTGLGDDRLHSWVSHDIEVRSRSGFSIPAGSDSQDSASRVFPQVFLLGAPTG